MSEVALYAIHSLEHAQNGIMILSDATPLPGNQWTVQTVTLAMQ